LSGVVQPACFPLVNRDDIRVGISTGLLAATASGGALVAIGSRTATVAWPFNAIAGHLLGSARSGAYGFVAGVTLTGIAIHVILITLAGVAVSILVRRGIASGWLASSVIAMLGALISIGIARRGGSSLARVLPLGDLLLFYLLLAMSLAVGIRLAFFESRSVGRPAQ
jgi:hypothetical protein